MLLPHSICTPIPSSPFVIVVVKPTLGTSIIHLLHFAMSSNALLDVPIHSTVTSSGGGPVRPHSKRSSSAQHIKFSYDTQNMSRTPVEPVSPAAERFAVPALPPNTPAVATTPGRSGTLTPCAGYATGHVISVCLPT
jgi:hypothetical protein